MSCRHGGCALFGQVWYLLHFIGLDGDRLGWTRALALLIHVAQLCFFYYLDEAADTRCSKPWPSLEVACGDVFTPSGSTAVPHCCMVKLDELARGFTFINVVGKTFGCAHGS